MEWPGPLRIIDSNCQGLDANLSLYNEHKLDSLPETRWPAVFKDGVLLDFGAVMADFRCRVYGGSILNDCCLLFRM
jgi:hypothetical protein